MLRNVLVATSLVAAATPALADTTFGAGSLIIPATATYQTNCGAVSMYGLVYNILRTNAWLQANGYGTIEVYYTYKETKASPNRCTPTDLHHGAQYAASTSGLIYPASVSPPATFGTCNGSPSPCALHDDAKWNDGCDFEILNNAATPVTKVTNTTATNPATDTNVVTIDTSANANVFPRWVSQTIQHTAVATTDVNIARYSGGSFVIADTDAATFLKLMEGSITTPTAPQDSEGNVVDFAPFRNTACTFGTSIGGTVNIHRAAIGFTAPTPRVFTAPPPRLALLATKGTMTNNVANGILQKYLNSAGLTYTGAGGCPPFGVMCPSGGTRGQIYDEFDFADLRNGKLASLDAAGKPIYKMFWAPHWQSNGSAAGQPTLDERIAIDNVATFLDGQAGLMAECHSIEAFEGAWDPSSADEQGYSKGQFQSCVKNAAGTACDSLATPTPFGFRIQNTAAISGVNPNCTDPTLANGIGCMYYPSPGDSYVQIGDYQWDASGGSVRNWLPNTSTNSIYRPGVLSLVSGVQVLDRSKLTDSVTARVMVTSDFTTRSKKDDDAAKSSILYLGGHDLSTSVSGTKVVLQTLLQLGDPVVPTVTEEVSRNSPIAYVVPDSSGVMTSSILQGTFERLTPAGTTLTLSSAADNAAFRFPDVKGHMRAAPLSAYTVAGAAFTTIDAAQLWDAADGIPNSSGASPNSYTTTGCTRFSSTCRTVFTNIVGGFNPARVYIDQAALATVGPLMASALTSTEHAVLMQRVNFGVDGATAGTFKPALGGVDRSTVAVIPTSTVAGASRPMMTYFGATDGMMHAVCANTVSPCAAVGQELWAFMPRNQLSSVRLNTTRIDGSPRVTDLFGDFSGSGSRSFRTILTFHTTSGDPTVAGKTPSVYALDVTNPANPTIVFEYTLANPASRAASELGQGLTITQGTVNIAGQNKVAAFVQTNNGGTGGVGSVTTAINMETGAALWQSSQLYANPPRGAGTAIPQSAIPGGAIAVDTAGFGTYTHVIVPNIYGDIWMLDATTGISKYGTNPLFRFTANYHPFGAPATIYANAGQLFAVAAAGGYHDLTAGTQWSTPPHQAVAVALNTPVGSAPLSQLSGAPYVPFTVTFGAGEAAFSQAQVIGGELYITTDSTDINSLTYGTGTTDTGRAYKIDLGAGYATTNVVIRGGASSVASMGNAVYVGSSNEGQQLANVTNTTGDDASASMGARVSRKLWLRTL